MFRSTADGAIARFEAQRAGGGKSATQQTANTRGAGSGGGLVNTPAQNPRRFGKGGAYGSLLDQER